MKTVTRERWGKNYAHHKTLFREWETVGEGSSEVIGYKHLRHWVNVVLVIGCAIAFIAMVVGFLVMGNTISRYHVKHQCAVKESKTGFDTEFVSVGFWNYGCYYRMQDGTLIKESHVSAVLPQDSQG